MQVLTEREAKYRGLVNRLGVALLALLFLLEGRSVAFSLFSRAVADRSPLFSFVAKELFGVFLYIASFTLPVFLFYLVSKGKEKAAFCASLSLPRETGLYLAFGVALIMAAATVNSLLVSVVGYDEFTEAVYASSDVSTGYGAVLEFLAIAVVPAFVEELLFRGVILNQLAPYGRGFALVTSALLFGAMHQDAGQFFYATVAGLVLGYIFLKTGSIYGSVLLHFVNNFYSFLRMVLYARLPSGVGEAVLLFLQVAVMAAGLLAFVLLLRKEKTPQDVLKNAPLSGDAGDEGAFETDLTRERRTRLFFSVPMTLFLALAALRMLVFLLLSLLLYA